MIVLSNTTSQTLTTNQSVTFNTVVSRSGCNECHMANSSSVKLKSPGTYMVVFNANVTGATAGAPVQLAVNLGGETIPYSTGIYTPAAANAVGQITIILPLKQCCCDFDRVTVTNTGTNPIIISANPTFYIKKIGGNC